MCILSSQHGNFPLFDVLITTECMYIVETYLFFGCILQLLDGMKHSCGILVSTVPKSTKANLSLRDPSEVLLIFPCEQCYTSLVMYGYLLKAVNLFSGMSKTTQLTHRLQVQEFLRRLVHWKKWGPEKRNSVQNGRHFL